MLLLEPVFPGVERVTARLSATRRDRFSAHLPDAAQAAPGGSGRRHPRGGAGAARRRDRRVLVLGALDRPAVAAGATAALALRWAVEGRLPVGAGG